MTVAVVSFRGLPNFLPVEVVFVSTNYRLLPKTSIKEMGGDVAKAIRWVNDHAQEYGGDPNTLRRGPYFCYRWIT